VAEGLPEEVAINPIQDDKGFIWFGTQNGLVKYDGYSFKVFKASSNKTDSTSFQMRSQWGGLIKAKDGKIWIAGESSGITSFDPITEKFQNFYTVDHTPIVSDRMMSELLLEDETGNIWFGGGSYLDAKFRTYRLNP
jgi:ligand-binding sensor domain-containing protein